VSRSDDVLALTSPACGHTASVEACRFVGRVLTNVPVEDVEARLRCTRGEARLIAVGAIAADPLPYSRLPPLRSAGSSSGTSMSCSSSTAQGSTSTNRRSGAAVGIASTLRVTPRFAARFPALARVGLCAATAVPLCRLPA